MDTEEKYQTSHHMYVVYIVAVRKYYNNCMVDYIQLHVL